LLKARKSGSSKRLIYLKDDEVEKREREKERTGNVLAQPFSTIGDLIFGLFVDLVSNLKLINWIKRSATLTLFRLSLSLSLSLFLSRAFSERQKKKP
jgi:hypothetical protein